MSSLTNQLNEDEFFPRYYNLEEVIDQQLAPLVKSIIAICDEHKIPMLIGFQYASDQTNDQLSIASLLPDPRAGHQITNATKVLFNI